MDNLLWEEKNNNLTKKMEEWRKHYHCSNNCTEWKKWKFCSHLRKARAQKFNKEISKQIQMLININ